MLVELKRVAGAQEWRGSSLNASFDDPYFWSAELGKSFGMATAEEKDAVSHRGRALRALIDGLRSAAG